MSKINNINRRKFLGFIGCSCCGYFLPSCGTVPITERRQLTLYPESVINRQAAKAYENFKKKSKSKYNYTIKSKRKIYWLDKLKKIIAKKN